ncbi:hypothetical protein LRQ11_21065 [Pseudomonas sp. MAFF 311095]|uniref:Uncharacterized protein n=1 Tax=Pseudomonas petroselini TaxID=2899822 RepID=A0ABS8QWX9_9PSED|nr:hypothetical protein [Pseudomonas petroselini]MCD7039553.1 hypothetical protein [Pseudomonas petroselini]MCD7047321.1 hypothetical protein [Pseudomonas petroselini]MCD7069390.1 hypothetical protein [Pseudomonas petroselini]MCD7081175.1 hypothetical protein [Pseudomonas petroselini]
MTTTNSIVIVGAGPMGSAIANLKLHKYVEQYPTYPQPLIPPTKTNIYFASHEIIERLHRIKK